MRPTAATPRSCIALVVACALLVETTAARAQTSATQPAAAVPAHGPGHHPEDGTWGAHMGFGFAHIGFDHASRRRDSVDNLGLALTTDGAYTVSYPWALHLGVRFGFTEFHRFEEFTDRGYRLGKWTTGAYRDVYRWAGRGQDKYRMLRYMGAFFVFTFLMMPLLFTALLYGLSPVSPFSYGEIDLMAAVKWGDGFFGGFVEFGLGLAALMHPVADVPLGGVGPALGAGIDFGGLRLSTRVMWSPPSLHGEPYDDDSHVYTAHLGIGFGG